MFTIQKLCECVIRFIFTLLLINKMVFFVAVVDIAQIIHNSSPCICELLIKMVCFSLENTIRTLTNGRCSASTIATSI